MSVGILAVPAHTQLPDSGEISSVKIKYGIAIFRGNEHVADEHYCERIMSIPLTEIFVVAEGLVESDPKMQDFPLTSENWTPWFDEKDEGSILQHISSKNYRSRYHDRVQLDNGDERSPFIFIQWGRGYSF